MATCNLHPAYLVEGEISSTILTVSVKQGCVFHEVRLAGYGELYLLKEYNFMLNRNHNSSIKQLLQLSISGSVLAAGAGAAAIAYSHYVEPFDIRLDRVTVRLPNAAGRLPKNGLTIMQLSDSHFHGGSRTKRERAKIATIRRLTAELEYDLLIHTGDFWHDSEGIDNVLALLDAVPKPKLGSFGVFGNHDYAHFDMGVAPMRMWKTYNQRNPLKERMPIRVAKHLLNWFVYFRNTPLDGPPTRSNNADGLRTVLEDWGMRVLHNESIHLLRNANQTIALTGTEEMQSPTRQVNGNQHTNGNLASVNLSPISQIATGTPTVSHVTTAASNLDASNLDVYLAGVDDWCMGRPNLARAIRDVPADAPLILLSHNPDIVGDPNLARAQFVISGHTHGGQLVVPVWGPAHTQSQYMQRYEAAGYTRRGETQIYISRGMGEGIPLRFMAHPQITLITVKG